MVFSKNTHSCLTFFSSNFSNKFHFDNHIVVLISSVAVGTVVIQVIVEDKFETFSHIRSKAGVSNTRLARAFRAARDAFWESSNN